MSTQPDKLKKTNEPGPNEGSPSFLNENGKLDFDKLMQTNPYLLSSFVNRRHDDDGESGGAAQQVALPFAEGNAALREAMGKSMSYAPLSSAEKIRNMSLSAQANLGLEAAQGLNMELGEASLSNPFGSSDKAALEQKDVKSIQKKLKGS